MPYEDMVKAMIDGDSKKVQSLVDKALNKDKKPPAEIIDKGLVPGIDKLGKMYEAGEKYLVDLIVASDAFKKSMEMLKPKLMSDKAGRKELGTVVLGTVEGDIHEIGKKLVGVSMEVQGFRVIDLGPDVTPETFSSTVKAAGADFLGMSSLITTTMINAKHTVDQLVEDGIRDDVWVMMGGAPVDADYVKKIGGDLYGKNAFEATAVAKKALGVK